MRQIGRQQPRQRRCQQDAEEAKALAAGGQAGASGGIAANFRAPALMNDGGQRKAEEGQQHEQQQPGRGALGRRMHQAEQAAGQHRQRQGQRQAAPAHAVSPGAQDRVDAGIGQARRQQQRTQQFERQSGLRIALRQVDVER